MFIQRVIAALEAYDVNYAFVGGYAVALHGAVRGTIDVDLIIQMDEITYCQAEKALQSIGLQARLPVHAKEVFYFREEYIQNRNMIAWSFVNADNPGEIVDIVVTIDVSTVNVVRKAAFGTILNVLSVVDLIDMKKQSGRDQDLEDVKALESLH